MIDFRARTGAFLTRTSHDVRMDVTPEQWRRWLDDLHLKLETDEDFRRAFHATPGKAVSLLGVPNEFIGSLISTAGHELVSLAQDRPNDEPSGPASERRWAAIEDEGGTRDHERTAPSQNGRCR